MNNIIKKLKVNNRLILSLVMIIIFLVALFRVDLSHGILHKGGSVTLKKMAMSLFKPDLSMNIIILAIKSCWQTFSYALISISIAVVLALPLGIFASGILIKNKIVIIVLRGIIGFLRAIHELIWAWIFVAAIGLSPIGAIFALSMPYTGYFGKIFADMLLESPKEPIKSLEISGANKLQQLLYGYFPATLPNMFSYIMYRLECATRSSSVLSFVGLGGIGFQIQISLQDLKYNEVWTFMFFLIVMILIIDKWGYEIRRRIK